VQNFIKLSAAAHELSCSQRTLATTPQTILPSLPRAVISITTKSRTRTRTRAFVLERTKKKIIYVRTKENEISALQLAGQ